MINFAIPGWEDLCIKHLVMDVNGTLAVDGELLPGITERLHILQNQLTIHLLTANTYGTIEKIEQFLNIKATILDTQSGDESGQKTAYISRLNARFTAAIGQGANDAGMLKTAALGISVMSPEGLMIDAWMASKLLMPDVLSALDLFIKPRRLIASLRK